VNEAVGSEHDGTAKMIRLVVKIGGLSAGFFDEQNSRGGIPAL